MNHCVIQQNCLSTCEKETRSTVAVSVTFSDKRDAVVCPKPRRLGVIKPIGGDPHRHLRWHTSPQPELCDLKAGTELLDIILAKGSYGVEQPLGLAPSMPLYFSGSPPSRVSNPLIQDVRFGDNKVSPISPRSIPNPSGMSPSPSSSARKVGCVRVNFGNNPAVRIEGFDCRLERDGRNCSIPALA